MFRDQSVPQHVARYAYRAEHARSLSLRRAPTSAGMKVLRNLGSKAPENLFSIGGSAGTDLANLHDAQLSSLAIREVNQATTFKLPLPLRSIVP